MNPSNSFRGRHYTPRIKQIQNYTQAMLNKNVEPMSHNTHMMLRKVFTDHAVYTKFVITDILENLPNKPADLARLLKNQDDISQVFMPYIGAERALRLAQLFKTHIERAGNCLIALKNGNASELISAKSLLFENSDQIGSFLSALNPTKLGDMSALFRQHNQYVLDIATAQVSKEYDNVVKLYDAYYEHMMMLADRIHMALKQN
jgi:hypothetical protein